MTIGTVVPYVSAILSRTYEDTCREEAEIRELRASTLKMKQEIHDMKCAAVQLLPDPNQRNHKYVNSKLGSPEAAFLDVLLYEAGDGDDADAGPDDAKTDEQRKWEQIKNSQTEEVDHEQFFKELDDPETGGFDCIARWLGKGIIK